MRITGAVLREIGSAPPYASTRPIEVTDLELDDPGPGELLVRIEAAGICHSDLSVVDGNRPRPVPMLLGHEAAGIVERIGEDAPELDGVRVGDRVVLTFLPRCGHCAACGTDGRLPCEVGSAANAAGTLVGGAVRIRDTSGAPIAHHLGASAFATHAVVNRTSVVRVDADVPPGVAALLGCAVLTGGGAVLNASGAAPDDTIMVVGLGGVGMAALLVAVALGHRVVAVDAIEAKLDAARDAGAAETRTPVDLAESGVTAPVVIEAAGHPTAFETAVAATAAGGTTVTVGLPSADARASIAPLALTSGARSIVGSYLGSSVPSRDIPRYAQLWREGRLPVERLISGRVALADVNEAMDALASGQALRQLITFDATPTTADPTADHSREDLP
ncbi:alcohol dehydrogenase catalytic domain-containing protein [Curtobacterium sp. Leaf261]|uniref:alcohol dehydrogenase catalytic domain-containing protein n=1 Tax=Curtobacterium sp. Leaf261 TaxID=1736311 RepID=UPI0006FDE951|nr:alcohol dehydrogenase catalytic domain-containing protein [Curtobacterium sp. Leaf261]KQO65328.1 alcohol dehydrogenase [Curtobacterium sp. Leaf261]